MSAGTLARPPCGRVARPAREDAGWPLPGFPKRKAIFRFSLSLTQEKFPTAFILGGGVFLPGDGRPETPPKGTECARNEPPFVRVSRDDEPAGFLTMSTGMNAPSTVRSRPRADLTPPTGSPVRGPAECPRILIVGGGGFGREVLHWARAAWGRDAAKIAGFLSADPHLLDAHGPSPPVLGDPRDFVPLPGDGLVLAIGIPRTRRAVAEALLAKGATFLSVVHPTAVVAPTATIGPGSIVCPHAVVSDSARLGACVLVNYHASLAHDAGAGDFAVLSPCAALAGGAAIGADAFLGLHASVGPGVTVGARSKVSANSCALFDVPADSLVHGVPGRVSPLLAEPRDDSR